MAEKPNLIKQIAAKYAKFTNQEKMIFLVASIFVIVASVDRFLISPVHSKLQFIDKEIVSKITSIKTQEDILLRKDRIEIEAAKYKGLITSEGSEEEEISSLMKEVETIANKAAVYLLDMKPSNMKEESGYKKYQVILNAEGNFAKIIEFMYNIETSKKLLKIEKLQLSPKSKDSDVLKCNILISKIILTAGE
jgi:Tfp pilus assembly protein PilO